MEWLCKYPSVYAWIVNVFSTQKMLHTGWGWCPWAGEPSDMNHRSLWFRPFKLLNQVLHQGQIFVKCANPKKFTFSFWWWFFCPNKNYKWTCEGTYHYQRCYTVLCFCAMQLVTFYFRASACQCCLPLRGSTWWHYVPLRGAATWFRSWVTAYRMMCVQTTHHGVG